MIKTNTRLSDVITCNMQLMPVLSCFGIRTGFGESTVAKVCRDNKIDVDFFLAIINTYCYREYFPDIIDTDTGMLINYLKKTHDYYMNYTIPKIDRHLTDLDKKHPGERSLKHIKKYFREYRRELVKHIEFEEKILFPMILKLISGEKTKKKVSASSFKRLKSEHTNVDDKLKDLKTILVRYLPGNADKALVFDLLFLVSGFDSDHINHANFEDRILIPKLKELIKT